MREGFFSGAAASGPIRLVRKFGSPRRLDADERLFVIIERVSSPVSIRVNDTHVGQLDRQGEYEITRCINPRNQLTLEVPAAAANDWNCGEVALEIRGPVYLRCVQIDESARRIAGEVAGDPRSHLELYVLRYGRTVWRSDAVLGPFSFIVPEPEMDVLYSSEFPPWRVELIQGANRWYVHDVVPAND